MLQGALKLLAGLRLMLGTETLRAVLWRMLGLLAVLMIVLMVAVFSLADYVAHLWLPDGDAWYWIFLSWLVWVLAILLAALSGVLSFTILGSAAIAPWLDVLAVRTESLHGNLSEENANAWWRQCLMSLANSLRPLLGLLAWGCVALAIFWIPVVGQVLGTAIWTYAGVRFLCFELMDTTASRKEMNFSQRKIAINERRFFWLGFGGLAMLMLLVPLLNLLVIPAAVVALSHDA
ncbi:MAG: hypothetical protein COB41_06235 [Proteobacteria bacterium]|nr:MAG: hypothetical protein COB41_06235 [Pseudomonadota bacterium]